MKAISLPLRIFLTLIGVGLVLLTLHLVFQHLNLAYNEKHGQIFEISNRFDVDDEASVPTWFSQAIWMGVSLASVLAACLGGDRAARKLWGVMALVAIFFSVDEVSGLHELSLQSLHLLFFGLEQSSSSLNAWWIVMPLILATGVWFILKSYKILRFKQWLLVLLGGGLFVSGAIGFELLGNDIPHNTFFYQGFVTAAEEGLEMFGGILILYAITGYLHTFHASEIKRAWLAVNNKQK